jgi:ATP-dependent Clp protease protease subunit
VIGFWGVSASAFRAALDKITAEKIIVNINSPGGDVFDGIAIFNDLVAHKAEVVVRVTGLAASAASLIAMAGDRVEIAENALFMIHNAWSGVVGNAKEMQAVASVLVKVDEGLAGTYAARTGGSLETIKQQMDDETWFSAKEAVDAGFANSTIALSEPAEASASYDLSVFKNAPKVSKPRSVAKKKEASETVAAVPLEAFPSSFLAELTAPLPVTLAALVAPL